RRDALLARDGPIGAFRGRPVRFVFRDTRMYGELLRAAGEPHCLRDGRDRSLQLDVLARLLCRESANPGLWPLVAAERAALEQSDIPVFTTRTDARHVDLTPAGGLEPGFERSSYDAVVDRLRTLDDADLRRQVQTIRLTLFVHEARAVDSTTT